MTVKRLLVMNLATDEDDPMLGFAVGWLRALAETAEHVDVITMRAGRVDLPANVRVRSLGREHGASEPERAARFYRELVGALRDRPQLCFAHMTPLFACLAAPLLRPRHIPIVLWYAHKSVTRRLRLALAVSSRVVSSAPGAFPLPSPKVTYVGQGIDTKTFAPRSDADPLPLVVSVGRVAPVKELETVLGGVASARDAGLRLDLRLVGPTDDAAYLERLTAQAGALGLGAQLQFAGPTPRVEVPDHLSVAMAHVNACATGAPDKAALEAMACGTPAIAANPVLQSLLGPHRSTLSFMHGDSHSLGQALARVGALSGADRRRMGKDLRATVVRDHSLDTLTQRLGDVFSAVAEAAP